MKSLNILLLLQWLAVVVISRPQVASSVKDLIHSVMADDGGDSPVTKRISKQLHGHTGQFMKHLVGKLMQREEYARMKKFSHTNEKKVVRRPSKEHRLSTTTHSKKETKHTAGSTNDEESSGFSTHDSNANKFDQRMNSLRTIGSDLIKGMVQGDKEKVIRKFVENARTQKRKGASVTEAIQEMARPRAGNVRHVTKHAANNSQSSNATLKQSMKSLIGDIVSKNKSPLFQKLFKGLTPKKNETDAVLSKVKQFQENKTMDQIVTGLQAKSKQIEFMSKLWMDKGIPLGYGDTVFTNSRALAQLMTKRSKDELNNLPDTEMRKLLQMTQQGHISLQNLLNAAL